MFNRRIDRQPYSTHIRYLTTISDDFNSPQWRETCEGVTWKLGTVSETEVTMKKSYSETSDMSK
jgi:hypothetical protein